MLAQTSTHFILASVNFLSFTICAPPNSLIHSCSRTTVLLPGMLPATMPQEHRKSSERPLLTFLIRAPARSRVFIVATGTNNTSNLSGGGVFSCALNDLKPVFTHCAVITNALCAIGPTCLPSLVTRHHLLFYPVNLSIALWHMPPPTSGGDAVKFHS